MFFSRDYVRRGDQHYQKGNFEKAAEHYLKAREFHRAAKVYEEIGDVARAVAVYDDNGCALEAAELLAAQGSHKEAITRFEKAKAFRQAAEESLKIRAYLRAGRLFEQAEMYQRAAECFLKVGEIEHAVRTWESESQRLEALRASEPSPKLERDVRELAVRRADVLSSIGRHLEAARLLAAQGLKDRAAPLFERGGDFAAAAQAYLDGGRFNEALEAVEKTDDDELRAEIYLNCARHSEAARIFARMERFDAAASAYEGDEAWGEAAEMWRRAGVPGRAADFFLRVGRTADAADCFAEEGQHEKAADAYSRLGKDREAADHFLAAGHLLAAGRHYLAAGDRTAAKEALIALGEEHEDYVTASIQLTLILIEEGYLDGAQHRYDLLKKQGDALPASERRYLFGRLREARGDYKTAESIYQKLLSVDHDFRDTAERHRDVRSRISAATDVFAGSRDDAAREPSAAVGRATAPILKPSPSSTRGRGEGAASEAVAASAVPAALRPPSRPPSVADGLLRLPVLTDAADLPFTMEKIEPWWDGAVFFSATDKRTGRPLLLVSFPLAKVVNRAEGLSKALRQVAALEHPTILKLFDANLAGDKVLLLYEPFTGETLEQLLSRGPLEPAAAVSLIMQLCEALAAAHKLGITHQWLSPRTILVDDQWRAKLVGIGMREILGERDDTGRAYLSPEVEEGGMVGPASDVYSLGVLATTLLNAQLPVAHGRQKVSPEDVRWPEEVEETVARPIRELLARSLSPEPLARPSTAELKAELAAVGLAPGQVLAERYEILGELGRGGMSRVYRARDRELGDEVAIKTLLTPAIGRSEDEDRLLREVRICRKISHPNVVRVHDLGRFPGGVFVIMELLEGPRLDQVIHDEAPLPLPRVKQLLAGVAAALAEAHRLKIVHRDLKPGNVILVDDRVKVLDFGIARLSDGSGGSLTRTGEVIGSPMFMAPEQIQGLPLDGTCDLYALGVIAFTLLTGREPFLGETTTAIVLKHLHEPPPDPRELRRDLPAEWVEVLGRLLAKDRKERIQTAEELAATVAELPE